MMNAQPRYTTLATLIDHAELLGATDITLRELAREALYAAGFSMDRPSFRTEETADGCGARVEILGEIAAEERVALALDVLGEHFSVSRYGQRILVLPRSFTKQDVREVIDTEGFEVVEARRAAA